MNPSDPAPLSIRSDLDALPAYVPGKSAPGAIKLASNETPLGPSPAAIKAYQATGAHLEDYPDGSASDLLGLIPRGGLAEPLAARGRVAVVPADLGGPSGGSAYNAAMIAALTAGTLTQAARAARAVQADHDPQPLLLHLMRSGSLTDQETVP